MRRRESTSIQSNFNNLTLWYRTPAKQWVEALAIGNGRLGAMIFGGFQEERIQFNEDTICTGKPHDYANMGAAAHFPKLCQMMFEMLQLERDGNWEGGQGRSESGRDSGDGILYVEPIRQRVYQPGGDLWISFPDHVQSVGQSTNLYRRELDLDRALSTVLISITWSRIHEKPLYPIPTK